MPCLYALQKLGCKKLTPMYFHFIETLKITQIKGTRCLGSVELFFEKRNRL